MFSRRSGFALGLVVSALAAVGTSGAFAAAQDPCPDGLTVSLVPGQGSGPTGRDSIYIVESVDPGTRLQRAIRVCNGTDTSVSVQLYSNAASIADGSFLPEGSPRADNELSRWTRVEPQQLTLRPEQPAEVRVLLDVPADATPGERYAVVYAELPPSPSSEGVGVASRVGVRQYVLVSGDRAAETDFEISSLTAKRSDDGRPTVLAEVRNTGARALDLTGELALSGGPGGVQAGPFPAEVGTTLGPGQTAPVQIMLAPGLPRGPWDARLGLSSGGVERAATATITFPDEAGTSAAPVPAKNLPLREDPSVVIPVAAGLLGLALLLLLLLWRRRPKEEEDEPERDERLLEPAG